MFLELQVGSLNEPLSGRQWGCQSIMRRYHRRVAYYQSRGMSSGDVVFLHYGNTLEFFVDLLAIWSLGGCVVPIDPRVTEFQVDVFARAAMPRFSLWLGGPDESIAARLSALDVKILDVSESAIDRVQTGNSPVRTGPFLLDQPALLLFTSGSTGQPKGVVHTHRSLRARWMSLRDCLGLANFRRTLCILPTHFGHGLICNCLFPWLSGQDLFILPPFRVELVARMGALLDENRITAMSSVPSMWRLVLKTARPPQAHTLQRVFCGSAPLSALLWNDIQEWTGAKVVNSYGITETASWVAGTTMPDFMPEDGLIGQPYGAIIRVLQRGDTDDPQGMGAVAAPGESGHIWINSPALMKGYLGRDDLTNQVTSRGWFHTGDIGTVDDRGWIYLRGREREEINKGGMKVYPGDVDSVAERFEETVDVCTFGFEEPFHGENVGIAVVLRSRGDDTVGRLHDWLKRHLAAYQMPQRWYVVDEIPRTSRGKVNRDEIARKCGALTPIEVR